MKLRSFLSSVLSFFHFVFDRQQFNVENPKSFQNETTDITVFKDKVTFFTEKEATEHLVKWGFSSFEEKLKYFGHHIRPFKLSDALNQEEFQLIADVMGGVPHEYDDKEIIFLFHFANMNFAKDVALLKIIESVSDFLEDQTSEFIQELSDHYIWEYIGNVPCFDKIAFKRNENSI